MKDYLGNVLNKDDIIVLAYSSRSNSVFLGQIVDFKITAKQEKIEYRTLFPDSINNSWYCYKHESLTRINSDKVVKYFGPMKNIKYKEARF